MNSKKIKRMTISAIFVAILIIQSFIPYLGYIRILPALPAITIIPLTVAVAGGLLGTGFGTLIGLIWGLLSLILAYTQPGDLVSLMLFQNPFIAILPRIAAGFLGGFIGKAARNKNRSLKISILALAGLVTSLTNTLLVIALTSLFFSSNPGMLLHNLGQAQSQAPLIWILLLALGSNGIFEAFFTAIVNPLIVLPVQQFMNKRFH